MNSLGASDKLPLTLRQAEAHPRHSRLWGSAHCWLMIPTVATVLAQVAQPGTNSPPHKWCFDRGQETQLCEPTEDRCKQLRELNTEIARSPCKRVEVPEVQISPTEPAAPPDPERRQR